MKYKSGIVILLLGLLLATAVLTACTVTNNPTPQAPLAEVVTVSVERPSATATPTQLTETSTPVASPTPSSTKTPVASYTPRPTITPRPTATPFPNLVWSDEFTAVATFASSEIAWSPVKNELLINTCDFRLDTEENPSAVIFHAEAPNFEKTNITPQEYHCDYSAAFSWNPDGTRLLLVGSNPQENYFFNQLWVFETTNFYGRIFNSEISWTIFPIDWMDNNTVVLGGRCGTGCAFAVMFDMHTEKSLASSSLGSIQDVTENYVATTFDFGTNYRDVGFLATYPQEDYVQGYESGPNVGFLRLGEPKPDPYRNSYNSSFQDWLPQTNKMLVMVGERGVMEDDEEFYSLPPMSDLQLWDVATDELTLVVPGGLYGRFSPNGHYLASIIPGESGPTMQVRPDPYEEILLEAPMLAVGEWSSFMPFFSFSPNNQYLAFFTTAVSLPPAGSFKPSAQSSNETFLAVLDLAHNNIVWSQPVPINDLFWSPDGTHLLHRATDANLTLLDVENGRTHPLTLDGGQLVTNPQWSCDGRYLSVSVCRDNCVVETAVLTFADNP